MKIEDVIKSVSELANSAERSSTADFGVPDQTGLVSDLRTLCDIASQCRAAGFIDENGNWIDKPAHHGWRSVPPDGYVLFPDGVARKVLGKIPMTADGCVYGVNPPPVFFVTPSSSIDELLIEPSDGTSDDATVDPWMCYSTREAALAAKEAAHE